MPDNCAACNTSIGPTYIIDHAAALHLHCYLDTFDFDDPHAPSVAEALRTFAHSQATRAIDMVLGS